MKLRYYLRGLGIGIAVTALLMGIALSKKGETLTDEQIRERALKLGMIDGSETLASLEHEGEDELAGEYPMGGVSENRFIVQSDEEGQHQYEPAEDSEALDEETVGEPLTEEELAEANVTVEAGDNAETDDETEADNPPSQSPTEEDTAQEETPSSSREEIVIITVYSGEGSGVVANKLKNAGLIEDAGDFDRFLCQNGYDKRLSTGDHDIVVGSSYREMAEALVKRKN
ncbi:MAG: hypothetical protein J1E61_06060 [Lachnospiraceae bacterium]|nr:hypothetical protein [Lachnospiraceae bacterium]